MTADQAALELVLERVRLRARRRAAWLRRLWAAEQRPPASVLAVADREADTLMRDRDSPEREAEWIAEADELGEINRELERVEAKLREDRDSRLARVVRLLGLGDGDVDLLHGCVAPGVDPALARVYGYLQDHAGRQYMTAALAARLFGRGRRLAPPADSALWRWGLIRAEIPAPGEEPALTIDAALLAWLSGATGAPGLAGTGTPVPSRPPLADWPVEATAEAARRALGARAPAPVRVQVLGPPGAGRRTFAAVVSERIGLTPLAVDAAVGEGEGGVERVMRVQRAAWLAGCSVAWHGDAAAERARPAQVPGAPLQFVIAETPTEDGSPDGAVELSVALPQLPESERRRLWRKYATGSGRWRRGELDELVRSHRATPGEIAMAARARPQTATAAAEAVRSARRGRLGVLAQLLECPFGWDDLVVPERLRDALEDLVYEARTRGAFWERPEARRMFPQGRGLLALFAGPPGTGKTMAAQVVAAELGQDLLRVDLSAVVSKWVGDTAKHIQRLLTRAGGMDVVLFFDECDALFGRRVKADDDAQARFANIDTSYLLQAIEGYDGVCLLASNRRADMDPAFIRRLRYGLEFPRPDVSDRLEIWRRVLDQLAAADDREGLEGSLPALAETVNATGAQIKAAVLAGLFRARRDGAPLAARHLMGGLERELMKEGRGLSERERERVESVAA
jgi:ATPase family associated with various cellular activities (AAA)